MNMLATPKMESGLVYVGGILIDDKHPRKIGLTGDETVVSITTKAQDHVTAKDYQVTIRKVEEAVPEVDKTPLMNKIEEAMAIQAEGYTQESYQALQDAIKAAQDAMNTVETKQDVEDAVKALQKAIDGLEKEPENPGGGDDGNKPGGDGNKPGGDSGNTGNTGKPGAGNTGSADKNSANQAGKVKTGDEADPGIMLFLLGSAGALALVIRKRRA